MTGWSEFALAMAVFIGSHFLPRLGGLRDRLIGAVGRRIYFAVYGLLSLVLLGWVIVAAGRAPYVELWPQYPWTRWVPNLAMPLAVILTVCGIGLPNRFTLGGRRRAVFDPASPGFSAVSRHPLLLALGLWALSHMAPNGDLAHVVLFGTFAVLALAAIPLFDMRARRALGADAPAFFAATAILSPAPLARKGWLRVMARPLAFRAGLGLILWGALLHLHGPVIGVPPFPF